MKFSLFLMTRRFTTFRGLARVAAECGVTPEAFARFEAGACVPPRELLPRLAEVLKMDPNVLDRLRQEDQTSGEIQPATFQEVLDRDRKQLPRLAQAMVGDERTGEGGTADRALRLVCQRILARRQPGLV